MQKLPDIFIDKQESPVQFTIRISGNILEWNESLTDSEKLKHYISYLEYIESFSRYCRDKNICLDFPSLSCDRIRNIYAIVEFFYDLREAVLRHMPKNRAPHVKPRQQAEHLFFPGLEQVECRIIQKKVNEIRDMIKMSRSIRNHQKCLRRLEGFQKALNKAGNEIISLREFFN